MSKQTISTEKTINDLSTSCNLIGKKVVFTGSMERTKSFNLPTFSSVQKALPETISPAQKKKGRKRRDGQKNSTIMHNIPLTNQEGPGGVVIF